MRRISSAWAWTRPAPATSSPCVGGACARRCPPSSCGCSRPAAISHRGHGARWYPRVPTADAGSTMGGLMDPRVEEHPVPVDRARAVLIYDGTCGLCRGGVSWISRRAVRGHFEFLPCQAPERRARYPWMDERACLQAMQMILPDGRVLAGDAAIPEILRR